VGKNATASATGAQLTGLKALAGNVLERNCQRNRSATDELRGENSSATGQSAITASSRQQLMPAESRQRDIPTPIATATQDLPNRQEERRERVLAMLADHPGHRYAVLGDDGDPQYPGRVVLAVAMRSEGGETYSCELLITADCYDGMGFLGLLEKHSGAFQGSRTTLH
jgi:hypothetical protein